MSLVGLPFANTFAFRRPVTAPVRGQNGQIVNADVDVPRIDHDEAGGRIGLLVTGGSLGEVDRCSVVAGDWELPGAATVLHEYADLDGAVHRRAFYTRTVKPMVDGVLRVEGHHRLIAAVPGFLKNKGGLVQYRQREWLVQGVLGDDAGAIGDEAGRGLAEA